GIQSPPPRATAGTPATVERQFRDVLKGQLRRVTAQRMTRSWQDSPKVDLFADVDFTRVEAHRKALKELGREAPSFNIYIAHAVVRAFQDLPGFNMHWIEGRIIPLKKINVGLAVALGDNLVTVSLKDLAGVPLLEIQRRFKGLIRKALQLSLSREELYGSSLTITNLGEFDITAFTAIINPPEVFILAVGKVEPRVVARQGEMVIAPLCTLVLSFDHRAVDGAPASRLMQRIKQHLESLEGVEVAEP
ncbi:MAG: 2-oxo acid dehydrogenase subunit E2, partial [Deltaproteobacteria bacterium]|nr:2-oxo acid dehydrogenase subunit E2 [Deltaproteobacteria bacterium]